MPAKNTTTLSTKDIETLETGRLKKTGEEYSLVLLSGKNIDQILSLEDIAFASLSPEEEAYLLKKDRDFFKQHFAAGNAMLGVVHNGKLIAQSVIINPTPAYPKIGMEMPLNVPVGTLTILQGVIVDPAFQGNNLMGVMTDAWLAMSAKNGRTEALAEVMPGNLYSWSVFLQKGMHIESISVNPIDNVEVYNIHGHLPSLSKVFNGSAAKSKICPRNDLAAQKKLIADGYKGVKLDTAKAHIEFRRPRKNMHCA